MNFELRIQIDKKYLYLEKDIPHDVLDNPFLLGLFVSSMSSGFRDALKREFEAIGYRVDLE